MMVPVGDPSADVLSALLARRKRLKAEGADIARQARNEEKKRQRRLIRAQGLSQADLLMLAGAKAAAKAKAEAKAAAKAAAKAKAKAAAAGGPPPPHAGAANGA